MKGSFRLGRIAGIEIGAHYTWLLAFFLIAWSLAQGFFPQNYPGWDKAAYWIIGVLATEDEKGDALNTQSPGGSDKRMSQLMCHNRHEE